jgi:hypothetical protein
VTAVHLGLLGDSTFDNGLYVGETPTVLAHLRSLLPAGWAATSAAVDGSVTIDLGKQLAGLPREATHLLVSIGGNDALMNSNLMSQPVRSVSEALTLLAKRAASFEAHYRAALAPVLALGKPVTACTIYNGNFPPAQAVVTRTALMAFNDAILRVALEHELGIVDLRQVCSEPSDYANPIEPSGPGGLKIAQALLRTVQRQIS